MARIWKEQFDPTKHGVLDASEEASRPIQQHLRAPTHIPHDVTFVEVCSFIFRFDTEEQIHKALAFYEQKLIPSGREPESLYSLRGYDRGES